MRPRKFTKINLSNVYAFRVEEDIKKRSINEMLERRREQQIHRDVQSMFRSFGTNPSEQVVIASGVGLAPTKEVKITVKETKVTPSTYQRVKNSMAKTKVVGKEFVRKNVFYRESFLGIDWDNFRRLPEEEFESLKDCYII